MLIIEHMHFWSDWWGVNENISPLELAARAVVMFVIALIVIRISGMRPFGRGTAFDIIITFLIGGILSRGVVGATPFFSTVSGAIAIVFIHKLFSIFSFYGKGVERSIKGKTYLLYKDGQFLKDNLHKANVTEADILEALRLSLHADTLDQVREVYLEKTGQISFVKKD